MRTALVLAAALLLAGCGGHKAATTTAKFVAPPFPLFPGAYGPRITNTATFEAAEFQLPKGTKATAVYDWYSVELPHRGWSITQRNETGIHAEKGKLTADIGVRGMTLEINQE